MFDSILIVSVSKSCNVASYWKLFAYFDYSVHVVIFLI